MKSFRELLMESKIPDLKKYFNKKIDGAWPEMNKPKMGFMDVDEWLLDNDFSSSKSKEKAGVWYDDYRSTKMDLQVAHKKNEIIFIKRLT